jgi:hypothetical protein
MSYRVTSSHVEALHDGRTVGPGDSISDADAKKNPRLIERGVLVKEPDKRKQRAQTTEAAPEGQPKPAEQEEESQ